MGQRSVEEWRTLIVNTEDNSLDLSCNEIGNSGAKDLAEALKNNTTLTSLDLQSNEIGAAGAKDLAEALKNNTTLTSLDLQSNEIGAAGAKDLAEALKNNTTLTSLGLRNNKIGASGAKDLAEALKNNTTLTSLDLFLNKIGAAGAKDLAEALKNNTTLTSLGLRSNEIGAAGAKDLAEALKNNTTLTSLDLFLNEIGAAGAKDLALLEALLTKNQSSLQEKDKTSKVKAPTWQLYQDILKLLASVDELRLQRQELNGQPGSMNVVWETLSTIRAEYCTDFTAEMVQLFEKFSNCLTLRNDFDALQSSLINDNGAASRDLLEERDEKRKELSRFAETCLLENAFEKTALIRHRQCQRLQTLLLPLKEHVAQEGVSGGFNATFGSVDGALDDFSSWKARHDASTWENATEAARRRLNNRAVQVSPESQGRDVFTLPALLGKCHAELEAFKTALIEECEKLEKDNPSLDEPLDQARAALGYLRAFVGDWFPKLLNEVEKQATEMAELRVHLSQGMEKPSTDLIESLLKNLQGSMHKQEDLEYDLKRLRRYSGKESDEENIKEKLARLKASRKNIVRQIASGRCALIKRAKMHYPELLADAEWNKKVGLDTERFELAERELWLEDISVDDFELEEPPLSSNAGKKVSKVIKQQGEAEKNGEPPLVLKQFVLWDDKARRHFWRQCSRLDKLRHSNVVRIKGVFADQRYGYILMPLYENGDLRHWLGEHPGASKNLDLIRKLSSDILNGLFAIHASGQVHCDVKPENIFMSRGNPGRALLGDFDGLRSVDQTNTSLMSTFAYAAPEYKSGSETKAQPSMDMYAFGLVLEDLFGDVELTQEAKSLIARLKAPVPSDRPTAEQALRDEFFGIEPEVLVDCSVCFCSFTQKEGVQCDSEHFLCSACLNRWLAVNNNVSLAPDCSVRCAGTDSAKCFQYFSSQALASHLSPDMWQALQKRVSDKQVAKLDAKLREEFEQRLEVELARSIEDQVVRQHYRRLVDLLTLKCPECQKAFVDPLQYSVTARTTMAIPPGVKPTFALGV